jgi:murein L,D-transpeptidase YcbB/YkuD
MLTAARPIDLSAPYIFTSDLSPGMNSNDVLQLQKRLNENAAIQVAASGAGSPGNETTYYGPAKQAAVEKYQALHGIQRTGVRGTLNRPVRLVADCRRRRVPHPKRRALFWQASSP